MIDSLEFPTENNTNQREIEYLKNNLSKKSLTPNKQITLSYNKKNTAYNSLIKKIRSTTPNMMNSSELSARNKKGFLTSFSRSLNNFYKQNNLNDDENDSPINLRNKFQQLLGKLNDNSTKEIGFNQLKDMIKKNNNQNSLRVFISCLSSYDPTSTMNAKEIYVLLYGYISLIFQENLMDPLDKPPNILKTINRILTHIRQFYLNQNSYIVHKAAAHSICEIFDNCMPKNNVKSVFLIFLEPFINMIDTGTNKISQDGSAICLSDFIFHLGKENNEFNNKILSTLDDKIISLCTKSSLDNPYLFESLFNLMKFTDIENYNNYFNELYQRFLIILSKVNKNKFNYLTKIFCLNILSLIANKVKSIADFSIGYYQEDILKVIEFNTKDKVVKVQTAAKEALINWYELKKINQEYDLKKREMNEDMKHLDLDKNNYYDQNKEGGNYVKKMDKLNFLRNLAKMAKIENDKVDLNTQLPETMKEQVYEKGIGNVLQFSNFLSKVNNKNENNLMKNPPNKNHKMEIEEYIKNSKQVKRYNAYKNEENNLNVNDYNIKEDDIKLINQNQNYNSSNNNNYINTNFTNNKNNNNYNKYNNYNTTNQYNDINNNEIYDKRLIENERLLDQISEENKKAKEIKTHSNKNFNQNLSPIVNNIMDDENINNEINNNDLIIENEESNKNRFKNVLPHKNKSYNNNYNQNNNNYNNNNNNNLSQLNKINKITNMEPKFNNYKKLKETLQNMLNTIIIKPIDNFEKNMNSRLDDMNNRINDLYLKLENYDSNRIFKDKDGSSYKIINNKLYKEVLNDIKKEINNKDNPNSQITKLWKEALSQVEKKNMNEAYSMILDSEDDLYLLRLICITGPILNNLSLENSRKVLMRINMIVRSHQIQYLLVSLIRNSLKYNVFETLNVNDQNDLLDSLYEISGLNNDLGREAAEIYTKITN